MGLAISTLGGAFPKMSVRQALTQLQEDFDTGKCNREAYEQRKSHIMIETHTVNPDLFQTLFQEELQARRYAGGLNTDTYEAAIAVVASLASGRCDLGIEELQAAFDSALLTKWQFETLKSIFWSVVFRRRGQC